MLEPLKRRALGRTTPLIDRVLVPVSRLRVTTPPARARYQTAFPNMRIAFALIVVALACSASAADVCVKTGWTTVARTGLTYGGGVWGQLKGFK